jgi:hypothetical protein
MTPATVIGAHEHYHTLPNRLTPARYVVTAEQIAYDANKHPEP